jgi:hypothetical protein
MLEIRTSRACDTCRCTSAVQKRACKKDSGDDDDENANVGNGGEK